MDAPDARFDLFLERLARELSSGPLRCTGISPSAGGDLGLRFVRAGRPSVLALLHRGAAPKGLSSEDVAGQALVLLRRAPSSRERALLRLAADRLRTLWDEPAARRWLDRRNRNVTRVTFSAEGLRDLLGDAVRSGQPFWHGWRLEGVDADPAGPSRRLVLRLRESRGAGLEMVLDTQAADGAAALLRSPLGTLAIRSDGRKPGQKGSPEGRPEAALGYLLGKGIHERMRWRAPAQPGTQPRPASTELRSSLAENCFRSGVSWRGYSSRFFNVWGDVDHFGLTAALGNYEPVSYLAHASRECVYSSTVLSGNLKYHSSPWGAVSFLKPGEYGSYHITDISNAALVSGGEGLLAEAIRQVSRAAPERRIVVTGNCDYHVIGDNVADVCRRCATKPGSVVYMNPPLPGFREVDSSNWWIDFLKTVPFTKARPAARSVNLAGFGSHDEAPVRELVALLERAGIKVQSVILPNISPGAVEAFGRAELTVLSPWLPVAEILEKPLRRQGVRVIKPPAPYGIAGTRRWLAAVAAALGVRPLSAAAFARCAAEAAPEFAALRRRSRGRAVGFVCDVGSPEELCSASVFFGLDLAAFFTELGFAPVVFSRGRQRKPPAPGVRVAALDARAPLRELLRREGVGLVYCDVCRGASVKRAGATPFAVEDLRAGLRGAQKTLGRLLGLAELETYGRYGDLL